MNRLFSLTLSLLLLFTSTGCVGRAAPAEPDTQRFSSQTVSSAPPPARPEKPEKTVTEEQPEEPEIVEEPQVPEAPYVRVVDPSKPMVALTFDDGPHAVYSDMILDVLEEYHAVATFFEVGRNIAACPEVLPRMEELGCEIGSHSNAHRNLSKLKKSTLLKDLDAADAAFTAAVGYAPALVRPPYGAVNKTVKYASERTMVTWTVDTLDWKSKDAQTVVNYLQNYGDLDGEIVLMHSIYESTAQAVAVLVPWLQEQGYQLVTVTELMAYYYGEMPQPDHFYGYTYFSAHDRTDAPVELPSMYRPEEPEAEPAQEPDPAPAQEPAAEEPPAPDAPEPFDPTGIVPASDPEPEPKSPSEAAPPIQETPTLKLTPSVTIPNPAMFYP